MGRFYFGCTTKQETFRIVKKGLCLMSGIVDCTSKTLGFLKVVRCRVCRRQ